MKTFQGNVQVPKQHSGCHRRETTAEPGAQAEENEWRGGRITACAD